MGFKTVTNLFKKEIKVFSDYDLTFVNLSHRKKDDAISTIESTFEVGSVTVILQVASRLVPSNVETVISASPAPIAVAKPA